MNRLFRSAPSNRDFPEHIAGIDLKLGLELFSGKRALYLAMLHRFLAGHKQADTAIRRALAANDLEMAELIAHNTKGVAGCLGATALQGCAAVLEEALRGQSPDLDSPLVDFETALVEVMNDLKAKLPAEHPLSPATEGTPVSAPPR